MDLFIALIPALVMITLVIITRKVLLSLGVGVLLAALIHESFNIVGTISYIWNSFFGIISDFYWYMPIVGFVVLIGAITAVIALSGGIRAFADWSVSKVKTPVAAKMLTWFLGLLIFIDDYFNALVIGEVSKPVTDEYKVSRAKLSYIIDSTSAPVVILMPISTWGAYIMGIMGGLFDDVGYTTYNAFGAYLAAVPYQFYPITAIIMVLIVIQFGINFGPMTEFETNAKEDNDTSIMEDSEVVPAEEVQGTRATQWTLIVPMIVLVGFTLFWMFLQAGFVPSEFMNQDITIPLFLGGVMSYLTALGFGIFDKDVEFGKLMEVSGKGILSMAKSAVAILILAWMVSGAIQDLDVGNMIADIIAGTSLSAALLPFIMFFVAGFIAFATGTSWGSFGILLPIAIPLAMATDPMFMPAIVAAVLGGAVFGDHSSPVSDTTVLSATGARATLHAHFISQLPYVGVTAGIAAVAYLIFGLTEILVLSYLVIAVLLVVFVYFMKPTLKERAEVEAVE